MAHFQFGSLVERVTSTATAAGTTTLTNTSTTVQQFTGSTTQTVVLPDATTMKNGQKFYIANRSTGVVTVQYNDASTAKIMRAGTQVIFTLISNGTSNGTWDILNDAVNQTVGVTKTANYTLTSSDDIIFADSSGGAFTLTLPTASSNPGKIFKIKKTTTDFNSVTISGVSSSVDTNGEEVEIHSNGSSWSILSRYILSEWTSYSLSISGTTTNPTKGTTTQDTAFWRRVGDSMEMRYDYAQTVAGADGSGTYLFSIPAGLTIDTAKIGAVNTICSAVVGDGFVAYSTVIYQTNVAVYDTGNVFLPSATAVNGTQTLFGSATGGLANATVQYSFRAKVPIDGWNG